MRGGLIGGDSLFEERENVKMRRENVREWEKRVRFFFKGVFGFFFLGFDEID